MSTRLLAAALMAASLLAAPAAGAPAAVAVDIEIAIDTTGSMGPSIRQAQQDVRNLVQGVRAAAPGARFAVIQFKDRGDTPEYELLQAMTADAAAIEAALARLQPGGGGDNPEAYNAVFRNSYADTATGWRSGSRKLVVVIGDAEPHGAGNARLFGCIDGSADPHDLSTARELRGMKTAERTLIMVRQASSATVALQCYQSLAAAAYRGGAARDGGQDVVGVIQALVARAVSSAPQTQPQAQTRPKPAPQKSKPSSAGRADRTAPAVRALPSGGYGGTTIRLLYRVSDASGRSSERVAVYSGDRVLTKSGWAAFGPAAGKTYYFDFPAPSSLSGRYRFCVQSRDPSGNVSAASCNTVTVA